MKPKLGFVALGNPNLDAAREDAKLVLSRLRRLELDVVAVEKMTWRTPDEIPTIAEGLKEELDLLLVLSTTAATSLCIAELSERVPYPLLVWALPTRYAVASSAAAIGYLRERGKQLAYLARSVDDEEAYQRVLDLANLHHTIKRVRKSRVGILGGLSPYILSSRIKEGAWDKFGISFIKLTKEEVDESLKEVKDEEVDEFAENISKSFKVAVNRRTLMNASRFHLALKRLMKKYRLDAFSVECWTNLVPSYRVNPCFGHFENIIYGCEGDLPLVLTSLILRYLTGITPFLSDPYGMNYHENVLTLCHCSAPLELSPSLEDVIVMGRTPVGAPELKDVTAFCNIPLKKGPATIFRIQGSSLDKAHLALGEVVASKRIDGNMCVDVRLKGSLDSFIQAMEGQHYLLVYGDVSRRIRELCKLYKLELLET